MGIVEEAFSRWRECRAEYKDVLYAAYQRAEEETNGSLLNAEGRRAGIDALTLFMGNGARAKRWASEELLEHWEKHPRITYADFERQWTAAQDHERWAS